MAAISSLQIGGTTYDIYSKSALSAGYAPVATHNHGYKISANTTAFNVSGNIQLSAGANVGLVSAGTNVIGITAKDSTYGTANFITANKTVGVSSNGTNVGTVNLSGISFSAGSNVTLGKSSNTITITAKDTTYTSLNGINSTEYNALTSTSANSRNPNAHQLSSHTNFSTYFNGTSANSALTSKSALSAGMAKSASQGFGILATATSTTVTGTNTTIGSVVNPKLVFSNSGQNQNGYIIWSDYNAANAWSGDASAYFGGVAISDGFVLTSDQGNSITLAKNLSATNFKATKISATNISGNLTGWATSANNAQKLLQTTIGFSRTTAQGGDGKKWCRIASKEITNFTTASVWGSCEAELNIYTKSYGDDNLVDRGKVILYCRWGHASASTPTYSMKTNGSRGARWLYWKPQQTSTSVSADSAVSAYAPFNGLKKVDIKIVATDTSVEWWLYNDVWDTTILYTNYFSDNITLYGKNSAKTLGEFKTYLEDNRTQWDDVQGDGSYINYALSAKAAPVATHTISSHSDSANFFSGNSARSACSATSAKNAGTATSAGTAANVNVSQWNADSARYILFGENKASTTVGYDSDFTYNPSSNKLLVKNISSTNITATTFSGTLSGNASSAKNAGTATYATSAGAAPLVAHDHNYTISAKTTAFNVSAGIQLSAGANIQITSAGTKAIGISAKDTTYTTANFITANKTVGVSSNGNNVGTVNLSGISFSAGTNVTLGKSTNVITITAKDTTYTSLNGINSTEYNALTSTSGNSRTPAAHQLSSHTNFTTYFDGTSAKKAQTAGSAGTAYTTQNVGNVGSATLIGSAKSGQSAYDWITTKSAALSAGSGIKFTSASANTLGICVTGILTTTDLNAWSSNIFSGNSARSAVSAKSAVSAGSASNAAKLDGNNATAVTGSAAAGSAASAWINSHSGTMIEAGYGIGTAYNDTTEKYTVGLIQSHCQGGNVANEDYSLALGAYSEASGGYNGMASFAFGWLCKATGPNTIAMGYSAEAKAYASYAIGYLISASGQYSVLLGYDNVSTANYTYHLGRNLSSNNWGVVLGRWNTPVNNADLIVGNGTANNARSNAMIISGGCVSATTYLGVFSGNISGSAASALTSKSLYVANHETNDTTYYPVWANGTLNNNRDIYGSSSKLQWNPKSGRLYVSNIVKVGGCSMTWNSSTSALDFNF